MEKITQIAQQYIGQRELKGNKGFQDADFQKEMEAVGWDDGEAWCATFAKLVFKKAYIGTVLEAEIEKLFSKSATATYANFDKSDWKTQLPNGKPIKTPEVGALVVWRMGDSWAGHIGVVTEIVSSTEFKTVEGNTDGKGGREGIEVAEKLRQTNQKFNPKGLNLIGFILPKEVPPPTH
jgi:hypothetical protein